jgi:hypothetical protein
LEARSGDRVSIDAKKVGQPRRSGVIRGVSKGISGTRYQVRWDDGHESVLAPGAGNMLVEGRGNGRSKTRGVGTARKSAKKKKKKSGKGKR